ncbi:hypothetical protein GPALN_007409 [Globodera pallida]|nr:hypothetical protein GPALN_007409 [Globodera pallida]
MLAMFFQLVIFVHLHENLFGLECKQGYESRLTGQKQAEAEECIDEPNAQYCVAVTCTTEMAEKGTRLTNVDCVCSYAEPTTDQQHEKALQCKTGYIDAKRRGDVRLAFCRKGYHYCYAAHCSNKADGHLLSTVWECSVRDNMCTELETLLGTYYKTTVSCKCLFGGKNVDLANENFMLSHLFPLMVTTTTGGSTPVTPTAAEHTGQ